MKILILFHFKLLVVLENKFYVLHQLNRLEI